MFAATGNSISNTAKVLACVLLAGAFAAGCSGSDGRDGTTGAQGPAGPAGPTGSPGPAGPISALDVTTATSLTGTITGVSGTPSQPTVAFKVVDQKGQPIRGLPATAVRFTVAKLLAGTNGASSQWVSYVNRNENPDKGSIPASEGGGQSWGTTATRQATSESAATVNSSCVVTNVGTYKDNQDGTYTYTFSKDLGQMTTASGPGPGPAIAFDGTLTHRIGFEVRTPSCFTGTLNFTNNPVYTYVPATGSTTTLPERRDIVNTAECSACHDKLAFHGGPRTDVQYCVTCHNPGTTDAQSGNSLDMKVMIHKIHRGISLPTVVAAGNTNPAAGKGYTIWGNSLSYNNFNDINFPQDQRNCTTCHRESDASTPQASNWRTVANVAACGACHDDVNWTTGANHGGIITKDGECLICHGPNSTLQANGVGLKTESAHLIPAIEAAKKFAFQIKSVTLNDVSGQKFPVVTFAVVDPTNGNAAYDLKNPTASNPWIGTDSGGNVCRPGGPSRLSIDVAFNTADYTNFGVTGQTFGQPLQLNPLQVLNCGVGSNPAVPAGNVVANPDGSYTITSPTALPAGVGTISVSLEGHPAVDVTLANGNAGKDGAAERIAVANVQSILKVNDASAVARRQIVNVTKCDECHKTLSLHGNNRTDNPQVCVVCHNPSATDGSRRPQSGGVLTGVGTVDGLKEQSIDMKWMIHAIHAGEERTAAGVKTVIYGYGGSVNDFGDVAYPGALNNCEGCHTATGYYPVDGTKVQGTTFSTGASQSAQNDDLAASPNTAACGACHVSAIAIAHMKQNGGAPGTLVTGNPADTSVFWTKDAQGKSIPSTTETCTVCHGPGSEADVKVMHGVGDFKFN